MNKPHDKNAPSRIFSSNAPLRSDTEKSRQIEAAGSAQAGSDLATAREFIGDLNEFTFYMNEVRRQRSLSAEQVGEARSMLQQAFDVHGTRPEIQKLNEYFQTMGQNTHPADSIPPTPTPTLRPRPQRPEARHASANQTRQKTHSVRLPQNNDARKQDLTRIMQEIDDRLDEQSFSKIPALLDRLEGVSEALAFRKYCEVVTAMAGHLEGVGKNALRDDLRERAAQNVRFYNETRKEPDLSRTRVALGEALIAVGDTKQGMDILLQVDSRHLPISKKDRFRGLLREHSKIEAEEPATP